ncbi:MAG: L,D-transpeptidase family protein [Pseudomonadota bacterium]
MRLLTLAIGVLLIAGQAVADESQIVDTMTRVLEGRLETAAAQARDAAGDSRESLEAMLSTELADMQRGGYATQNIRAFSALAPFWDRATSDFLSRHRIKDGQVPDAVLLLPGSVERVVAVDLTRHVAFEVVRDTIKGWRIADTFYVSSGRAGSGKRRRGDRKTPVGLYFPLQSLDTSKLPARYGVRAVTLDYPNALDRMLKRTGDGIWLHGINPDANIRPPLDTDGCVAFGNVHIEQLADRLRLSGTPIVMSASLRWRAGTSDPDEVVSLRAAVDRWANAWARGDVEGFVALYARDYKRFGQSPEGWRNAIRQRFSSSPVSSVAVTNLALFRADTERGIYLARFDLEVKTPAETVSLTRRIYWRNGPAGWEIVAEQGN